MSALSIRIMNAARLPLDDTVDVDLTLVRTNEQRARVTESRREAYGNLQLSFFSSVTAPLQFKVDADIDDAAGIEHAFQVLEHFFTHGDTHPYDIHEILLFYQRIDPGYELIV